MHTKQLGSHVITIFILYIVIDKLQKNILMNMSMPNLIKISYKQRYYKVSDLSNIMNTYYAKYITNFLLKLKILKKIQLKIIAIIRVLHKNK